MVVSWWLLQAPKDEAKSSEELDPDTDDWTRPDKPIRRSAKDKVCLVFFPPVFFFRFYAYYLLCLFFFMFFSFTCNSHGLGAVL